MPAFAFRARTGEGRAVRGQRVAESEPALALELAGEGLFLVHAGPAAPARAARGRVKVSSRTLSALLLHLAAYLEAGIPLLAAFQDFRDPDRPRLEAAVMDMGARMAEGALLSEIMAAYPDLFLPVHVGMVRAGEATGRLDEALRAVIKLVEWNRGLRAQVRRAATYPLLLLGLLAVIILLVCAFSLPPILRMLEELHIALPTVTRVFLFLGHGLSSHGWLLIALPLLSWQGSRLLLRNPALRLRLDSALLDLPVVGGLLRRLALSRFANFLAAQYRAGIPLIKALRNSEEVVGNARIAVAVRDLRNGVEEGGRLAASATRAGAFPQIVIRMLAIGEETGKLEETLERVAAQFDAEVSEGVERIFQVLDPLIKVFMGCLLVFVATAVLLPLYMLIGGING